MNQEFLEFDDQNEDSYTFMHFLKKNWKLIAIISSIVVVVMIIIIAAVAATPSKNDEHFQKNDDGQQKNEPYLCLDADGQPSHNCFGAWFYHANSKTATENAQWAADHGYNYVFWSGGVSSESAKQRLTENAKAFAEKKISFHIMTLEDMVYIDNFKSGTDTVKAILDYINQSNLQVAGIHIDCEPHSRSDWKSD